MHSAVDDVPIVLEKSGKFLFATLHAITDFYIRPKTLTAP
jgi:hypothetical protein